MPASMSARLARCSRFSPIGENAESLPLNSSIDGLTIEHQLMLMSVGNELDRSHREGRWGVSPTRAAEFPNGWCLAARARPIPGGEKGARRERVRTARRQAKRRLPIDDGKVVARNAAKRLGEVIWVRSLSP
jgi:hypothetical protein